jgi:puromycin-sensitive aminopeptidase
LHALLEQVGGPAILAFLSFGQRAVLAALQTVGWDARPTDGHTDKLLRASVISMLDTFAWNDSVVAAEARRRFDLHWEEPSVLPAEYKTTVYKIVLLNGGEAEYEQVLKTFYATEDNSEKRFAFALGQ